MQHLSSEIKFNIVIENKEKGTFRGILITGKLEVSVYKLENQYLAS